MSDLIALGLCTHILFELFERLLRSKTLSLILFVSCAGRKDKHSGELRSCRVSLGKYPLALLQTEKEMKMEKERRAGRGKAMAKKKKKKKTGVKEQKEAGM